MKKQNSLITKLIEKKLGGYQQVYIQPETAQPLKLSSPKNVAIIGGGLAGISAAIYLADRGFQVDIYEGNDYLGGKLGSWKHRFADGYETNIEHGFHAFFRQYYNLRRLLKKIGAFENLMPIEDYLILTLEQGNYSFKNISTTPILNLLSLRKTGVYHLSDVLTNLQFRRMLDFLKYEQATTFARFDTTSFQEFADRVRLPKQMRLMFTTFSRAFFAEPHLISLAELIKSFHFYFLSNNHGLIYDVLNDDFARTLWDPVRSFLQGCGARILLNRKIDRLEQNEEKFRIGEKDYDYTVLATDIVGTRQIVANSEFMHTRYRSFTDTIRAHKESQRYAVLRLWIDRDIDPSLPFFLFTDALKVLDSITSYHRMEKGAKAWVEQHGGGIFELHSYAVPDNITAAAEVRDSLLNEFQTYFPHLRGCAIRYEYFQLKKDFTAFHTGLFTNRSGVRTPVPNLYLAGDWVKIPIPAMLMEAATTSALFAVNEILNREKLQPEAIYTVPLKGIFC